MSDSIYMLAAGVVILAIFLAIHKLVRLFRFTREQKRLLESSSGETPRQRRLLRIIQVLIILPFVFIVIYILIKQIWR